MAVKGSIVKTRLMQFFIGFVLLYFFFYTILTLVFFGIKDSLSIMKYTLLSYIIVVIAFTVFYYISIAVFRREISSDDEKSKILVNRAPIQGAIILNVCLVIFPVIINIFGWWLNIIVSVYQTVFFMMAGMMLALTVASIFFYKSKVLIYKLRSVVKVSALSLFHKILIPTISATMLVFLLISTGLYYQNTRSIYTMYSKEIAAKVDTNAQFIAAFFGSVKQQLLAISKVDSVMNGNKNEISAILSRMGNDKSDYVQSYIFAGLDGQTIDSLGSKGVNIKEENTSLIQSQPERLLFRIRS